MARSYNPSTGKEEMADPWGLLASQSRQIGKFQQKKKTVSKIKIERLRKTLDMDFWFPHALSHTCTHMSNLLTPTVAIVFNYKQSLETNPMRKYLQWSHFPLSVVSDKRLVSVGTGHESFKNRTRVLFPFCLSFFCSLFVYLFMYVFF